LTLSLLAKPTLVTLPALLVLLDIWPLRRTSLLPPETGQPATWRRLGLEKLVAVIPAILLIAWLLFPTASGDGLPPHVPPLTDRIDNAIVSYARYLWHHVWFADLALPYPQRIWSNGMVAGAGALLAGITALSLWQVRRRPWLMIGWAWFVIAMGPMLGFRAFGDFAMADRFTYIPAVGLGIAVVWSIPQLTPKKPGMRRLMIAATTCLLGGLVASTIAYGRYWQNSERLFNRTIAVTGGDHESHHALGQYHVSRNETDQAIDHFRRSIEFRPTMKTTRALGMALARDGQIDAAIAEFEQVLRNDPDDAITHARIGTLCAAAGQADRAIHHLKRAVELKPDNTDYLRRL
ncbi:MAG: tetratricopeptide repeat protein, partial [Phycisphaeraceae bacterium]|nr:tetratricopeptide repeat protein [Phycisphaeraceae bacterium]